MALSDYSKTLKRRASTDLETARFKKLVQSPPETPSNILAGNSDQHSPEQEHNSVDSVACSPLCEEIDIEQRVANYLERNTPHEGEKGKHEAHQNESQQLLRELLLAYRDQKDQLNEVKNSAGQLDAEKQEAAMQFKKFLGEPRRISTKGLHDLLESGERKDDTKEILLRIERVMNSIHESTLDNPYALVLLDGDGYIFNEDLIRQGLKGGEIAATRLRSELHKYFDANNFKGQRGWRLVVFNFASIDGLAHKMEKFGRILESKSLRQFTAGLNQSNALINVVDVGQRCKEVTDFKIRAFFDLFAPVINLRCRHVVLGCSHDKGYLRMLADYKHQASYKDSITLLETKTPAEGFQDMPFKKLHLHDLLVSSTILNTPPTLIRQLRTAAGHLAQAISNTTNQNPAVRATNHSPLFPQHSPAANGHDMSTRLDGNGSKAIIHSNIASLQTPLYPRCIAVNGSSQRVDLTLPQATTPKANKAAQKLKKYLKICTATGAVKPCNDWYLVGQCAYGNSCPLDHVLQLPQAQIEELARMARQHPCPAGSACRDKNCVLGHSCPYDGSGGTCAFGEECRLEAFHGVDTTIVEMWDPVGNAVQVGSAA